MLGYKMNNTKFPQEINVILIDYFNNLVNNPMLPAKLLNYVEW